MHTERDLDNALNCLNNLSSFLAFEKLDGNSSHFSCIFHYVCTQKIFGIISAWQNKQSVAENNESTAHLLLDLHSNGLKAIQLLGHCDEDAEAEPARAFFITYNSEDAQKYKTLLLSHCRKYNQPAVAIYESNQIRVLNETGGVEKIFTRSTMEPVHIKNVWGAMAKRKFSWLESGYLSADPISLCGPLYDSVGLRSDIPINLLGDAIKRVGNLIRYRPYSKEKKVS